VGTDSNPVGTDSNLAARRFEHEARGWRIDRCRCKSPYGPMDKAPAYGAGDSGFEFRQGLQNLDAVGWFGVVITFLYG
jgi:hypothetical protein